MILENIEREQLGHMLWFEPQIAKITWTWEFVTLFSKPARRGVLSVYELDTKRKVTSAVIARNSNQDEAREKAIAWIVDRLQRRGFRP